MKRHSLPALMLLMAAAASAQSLTKDITIEREIHPTLRAASRINAMPTLLQPSVSFPKLTFSDMTSTAAIPGMITTLEPAASADAIAISPYRGYAGLGYFPTFNLGTSAGYRFIQKPDMVLGAWMQYDGNSYKAPVATDNPDVSDDKTFKRHAVTAAVDFTKIFSRAGRLDISADYTFNAFNRPWIDDSDMSANKFDITASWSARRREMAYFVSAGFSGFSFSDPDLFPATAPDAKGLSQRDIKAKAGTAYFITPSSSVAGHIDVDFTRFNRFDHFNRADRSGILPDGLVAGNARTIGVISFAPSYRYRGDIFRADIGLRLQFTSHSGKTLHVAPDIRLDAKPSSIFSAYVSFGGGEHINRLSTLFGDCHFISPSIAYGNSHVPFTAEAGVTLMPATGVSVILSGGYAAANDWLMLSQIDNLYAMAAYDLRAWHASIEASWKWRGLMTLSGRYSIAPGSYRDAYYLNTDRARHVAEIKATVNPIQPLEIEASFEMRACRSAYIHSTSPADAGATRYDLGNSSSLNIGGRYSINASLSVFARGENILDRRADILPGLEQQGIKGLVGVAVKF